MKLSEQILKARTDRPDEWKMDEYAREARILEDSLAKTKSDLANNAQVADCIIEQLKHLL